MHNTWVVCVLVLASFGANLVFMDLTKLNFLSVGSQLPPRTLNIFNQSIWQNSLTFQPGCHSPPSGAGTSLKRLSVQA